MMYNRHPVVNEIRNVNQSNETISYHKLILEQLRVPSYRLTSFSEHRGSSCKTELEHHLQHKVPNLFQTIHKSQVNIPLIKIPVSVHIQNH